MSGRYRDRRRREARASSTREPRHRILVLCEGTVTEPEYLRTFIRWQRNPLVDVEIADEQGVPKTLVDLALRRRDEAVARAKKEGDEFLTFDEVWCVFDVDEHPHLNDAWQRANAKEIHLAVSNPCFELWLLLHHQSMPGARTRYEIDALLSKVVRRRGKHVDFHRDYERGYDDAVERARRSAEALAGDPVHVAASNPSTTVYRLTEAIRAR